MWKRRFTGGGAGSRGFTLIEVMIVVLIIGILAAIAYPAYLNQVAKSRRADAQTTLVETAQDLERCYTEENDYRDCMAFPFQSDEGWYEITAPTLERTRFTLRATAVDDQLEQDGHLCARLELSHTGQRDGENAGGDPATDMCWGG